MVQTVLQVHLLQPPVQADFQEPQALLAIERSRSFKGRYHVLHGALSPLDGIGPEELKIAPLIKRLEAADLISRLRDTADERRVLIRLTTTGRALKKQARCIPGCVLQASHCTVDEAMALTRQVKALREQLLA